MRWLLLLLLVGCHTAASRARELDQCRTISADGDALTRCLIVNKDWDATEALRVGLHFQAVLDSIARDAYRTCAKRAGRSADSAQRKSYRDAGVNPNAQNADERQLDSTYRAIVIRSMCGG